MSIAILYNMNKPEPSNAGLKVARMRRTGAMVVSRKVKKGFVVYFIFWGFFMYCCGERLSVTRLVFRNNGYYKRVDFGFCQGCGTAHTLIYTMYKDGHDREKHFSGKIAINEFKKYQRLKNNTKQGSKSNQNVYYGDFRKTRKKDKNGNPVYLQLRKNFSGDYEILNEIQTTIHRLGQIYV